MNKKYYKNNRNRFQSIDSDDLYIPDRKRVRKFRKDKQDRDDIRYNNSNKQ